MQNKQYYIYILTNKTNKVLYIGVTSNLIGRIYQHKNKFVKGFTQKYNATELVYYEIYRDIRDALQREKQLKGGSRKKKILLIEGMNPEWKDLYEGLF